jgi:hypothetical protein
MNTDVFYRDLAMMYAERLINAEAALEFTQQVAMAFVFDANRPRAQKTKCYWCDVLLPDNASKDEVLKHVVECREKLHGKS